MNKPPRTIHVLTPFRREENRAWLAEHLKQYNAIWHTLEMETSALAAPYEKINIFIDTQNIFDEAYYSFLCDDDAYEAGLFDNLPDSDVIFVSMKRGDVICGTGSARHPTNTLLARPENIQVCQVGLEQIIVKGKILRQMRFNLDGFYGDGEMAIWLKEHFNCIYEPQRFVLFNYLEPGRYLCRNQNMVNIEAGNNKI